MKERTSERVLIWLLRVGTFLCFGGWAWVHFYWEGPYGTLVWHDSTFEMAQNWGLSWEDFVGTGANDGVVQVWLGRLFWLYLACAVASLVSAESKKLVWLKWIQSALLVLGMGLLSLLAFAKYVKADFELPALVEQGGQVFMPLILVLALVLGVRHWATIGLAMLALVLTFVGHGSYAMGFWPTPPQFVGMTTLITEWEYEGVIKFLWYVGLVDLIICIGLLTPMKRLCVGYAFIWGMLTSIARPYSGMSWDLNYWGADQYLHEAIYRAPHFVIPAFLFVHWTTLDKAKKNA